MIFNGTGHKQGTAIVVIHFRRTNLIKMGNITCVCRSWFTRNHPLHNYGNHSEPVILAEKGEGSGDIYFVN